tara:strand:- start:1 stop:150 length:150 start_codon:yes stop_codon:yes gene_type:complete
MIVIPMMTVIPMIVPTRMIVVIKRRIVAIVWRIETVVWRIIKRRIPAIA